MFQRCISPKEGREILREIHEGDCGHHADSKSLVAKAFHHMFYWLTAHADAEYLVSKCDAATVVQFMKKVIFRFDFPRSIITDNGTTLSKGAMEECFQREHIQLDVSSVAHPQSNGQAKRAIRRS